VGINALSAILRIKNGKIAALQGVKKVMEDAVGEAILIAEVWKRHCSGPRYPFSGLRKHLSDPIGKSRIAESGIPKIRLAVFRT
jgi:hypothetical protein